LSLDVEDILRWDSRSYPASPVAVSIATHFSIVGYTKSHFEASLNILLDAAQPNFITRFDRLCDHFRGVRQQFVCRFAIKQLHDLQLREYEPLGLTLDNVSMPRAPTEAQKVFYTQIAGNSLCASIRVEAVDPGAAKQAAEERLAIVLASRNLLDGKPQEDTGPFALVTQDGTTDDWALEVAASGDLDALRVGQRSVQLENVLRVAGRLEREDRDQLTSSLQHHRLALNARTTDARLVNLWIAPESITRNGKNDSIIGTISGLVAPNVAGGNVRKIITAVAVYIRRFWASGPNTAAFLSLFPHSDPRHLAPKDLLAVVLEGPTGPRLSQLLTLVSAHSLLRWRIQKLAEYFGAPEKLCQMLERHRDHIDWQLRRIYRSRNDVMHRGRRSPAIARLTQHLHAYYLAIMHNLVGDLLDNDDWRVAAALAHRQMLFEHYLGMIKAQTNTGGRNATRPVPVMVIDAIFDPVMCLRESSGAQGWPISPAGAATATTARTVVVPPQLPAVPAHS
jgi:hypothetical protein